MHRIDCILRYVVVPLITFRNLLITFTKPAERKVFSINDSVAIKFSIRLGLSLRKHKVLETLLILVALVIPKLTPQPTIFCI